MSAMERQTWAAAGAMWLVWAGHVYFDAMMFRCSATFVLAILLTVTAGAQTIWRLDRC